MLRLRYQREHERGMQSAIRTFALAQDRRLKYGDAAEDEDDRGGDPQAGATAGAAPLESVDETAVETAPDEAPNGFVSPPEAGSRFIAKAPEVPGGSTVYKQVTVQSEPPRSAQPRPGEARAAIRASEVPPAAVANPPPG
jgi:hypothetical protein